MTKRLVLGGNVSCHNYDCSNLLLYFQLHDDKSTQEHEATRTTAL